MKQDKPCSNCGKPYKIINKKFNLCQLCNNKRLHPNQVKKIYQFKRTQLKPSVREPTGELELFRKIWRDRPHICTGCGNPLHFFHVNFFSHCIAKSLGEEFRMPEEIIFLECNDCHTIQDKGTLEQRHKLKNFDAKMKVIKKYNLKLYYSIIEKLEYYYNIIWKPS